MDLGVVRRVVLMRIGSKFGFAVSSCENFEGDFEVEVVAIET